MKIQKGKILRKSMNWKNANQKKNMKNKEKVKNNSKILNLKGMSR